MMLPVRAKGHFSGAPVPDDPTTFTKPWTAVVPISRLGDDTQIYEYACHEGNYAMTNLLNGGRIDAAKRR